MSRVADIARYLVRRGRRPPPGYLVPVYGREMHVLVTGSGGPTVILDGPDGAGTAQLGGLAAALDSFACVVRYDRAGYGWSDAAPTPLTADESAQDLRTALEHAGIAGPYLLVGHAYGGSVLRCLAHRYRRGVSGVVLVDVPPPGFIDRAPCAWCDSVRRTGGRRRDGGWRLPRRGTARSSCAFPVYAGVEPAETTECRHRRGRDARARAGEISRLAESEREVASSPFPNGVPLVSIRHDVPPCSEFLSESDRMRAAELWVELHDELAAGRADARIVRAGLQPRPCGAAEGRAWEALVVDAVRRMVTGSSSPLPQRGPEGDATGSAFASSASRKLDELAWSVEPGPTE